MWGEELSDLGEFGLLKRLLERLPAGDLIVPPGDDAALLPGGTDMLATADLLVEGRHFDLAFSRPADVGFKAIAANASDIAAMGGRPRYALISIGAPPSTRVETVDALYDGIAEGARAYGVVVAGGDTVGADMLVVSVAMLGEPGDGVVTRSGARNGDVLCVTGELGGAAAGLALLRAAASDPDARVLLERFPELATAHRRGRARVQEGQVAASLAHAMVDLSDGLLADAGHICEQSGLGVLIDAHALPVASGVHDVETWLGRAGLALNGGDDYELCMAVTADDVDALTETTAPTALTVIGRFTAGSGVEVVGAPMPDDLGWDSFR